MGKLLWLLPAVLATALLCAITAPAQESLFPRLVVPAEQKAEPIKLTSVKVDVKILGYLTETRMTMTFSNPNNRVLAGDLFFPLPEGATVSGYALDVGGVMVDGVVVEKDKGRRVYEKIVRQGIDPGLVEWVKGNNFKTRVFPIPPLGSRTVMVRYVSELIHDPKGASYHLPLGFADPVGEFHLRMEVVKPAAQPVIKQGELSNFSFERWRDSYVAETTLHNRPLTKDLVVALPDLQRQKVLVQKDAENQYYFIINDFPKLPDKDATNPGMKSPDRILIFWDASGSRGKGDHQRELRLLEKYLARYKTKKVQVDLVFFRNEAQKPERFIIDHGNSENLMKALSSVDYDGGTQMGCLSPEAGSEAPDMYMLFTDGLSNFGREEPTGFKAPVYAFAADATTNHAFLRHLAQQTGGEYFNLDRLDDEAVLSRIGKASYSFISATTDGGGTEELYPRTCQPVYGRFALTGKIIGEKTKITINYGTAGNILTKMEYEVSKSDAVDGELVRLFFAQKKIDELQVFPKRNEKVLVVTGKEFGLVTPGTSLIVLESLQQYVEHKIAPPKSLPDMRTRYFAMIENQQHKEQVRVIDKLEQVVAMWQKRVDWWNTEFTYPEDYKFKPAELGDSAAHQRPPRGLSRQRSGISGGFFRGSPPPSADESSTISPSRGNVSAVHRKAENTGRMHVRSREVDSINLPAAPVPAAEARMKPEPESVHGSRVALDKEQAAKGDTENKVTYSSGEGSISMKPWDPSTPYLTELKEAKPEAYLKVYMALRKKHGDSPAFFLDCADFFFNKSQEKTAIRVLSNIAELELENPHLLRVLGHRLAQANLLEPARMVFEQVLQLRPEEPQSFRDLALVMDSLGRFDKAIELFYSVITSKWDRFGEIEVVALMELNRTIARAKRAGMRDFPVDPRLVKLLDLDVRIVLTWDADMTDMDLWVTEPSAEKAYFQHRVTTVGGLVSRDITDGYGPEEYVLRKAMKGQYKIQANYYGSGAPRLTGAVTLQADVFTNFGRPDEKRSSITVRLKQRQEVLSIGDIEFK